MTIPSSDFRPNKGPVIYDHERLTEKPAPKRVRLSTVLVGVFFVLILLKQLHILKVSWWWICLPIYLMPAGYGLLIAVIILIWMGQELRHRVRRSR